MSTPNASDAHDPLSSARIAGHISELTQSGQDMITRMSNRVNDVQFKRAMQMGYIMACQDHGLPVPEMQDPGIGF